MRGAHLMRVLVVEDSKTQARRLADLLSREGLEVEIAHDGTTGLARALASKPALIVSDVLMPGLDGFELCRRLRKAPETRDCRVMLLTSLGDPMDVLRALSAGADNFATKPYRDDDLLARVRRILGPARESSRAVAPSAIPAIVAAGERFEIEASTQQILEVLYSALEDARVRAAELETSRAELQKANAMRDEMMGIVAHELRTPLTTISLRAQLARRGAKLLPEPVAELVALIERSTARMLRIIEDLLEVSKLDAGTLDVERRVVDLGELVEEVAARARAANPDFRIEVRATRPLRIEADPVRIDQVLTNLLSNAVKYSGDARVVEVEAFPSERQARVRVRDHGIGIEPAQRERVFDRFFRTGEGRRAAGGFGLGLYICRKLVELHGGTIGVDSEVARGSTFWFALPRA
jgi:signal transduction histidine kinase